MFRPRIIPVLLMHKGSLVKSVKFKNYKYVGDPINAVKIFNEKGIDELILLDIDASREGRTPNFEKIKEIASEAFVPFAYGGGISDLDHCKTLFYLGVEKLIFNTQAYFNSQIISEAAKLSGSQSIVVSIDVKKNWLGRYEVFFSNGTKSTKSDPLTYAKQMQDAGAGEIFLNCIDKDGTYSGYNLSIIKEMSECLDIPLIACGGASSIEDFLLAFNSGASALAAGSMFVFQRPHNAVLISYPSEDDINNLFNNDTKYK